MPELARDPSEQCNYVEVAGLLADAPARRCLNRCGHATTNCDGPHRFVIDEPYARATADNVGRWTRGHRQSVAMGWATAAFSAEQATNSAQRALRLLEEAVELYQACVHEVGRDAARVRAHELVDFVFERPAGEIGQEIGGVSVCLLVLAEAVDLSADACEVKELHRVLSKPVDEFTKRNAAKNAAGFLATANHPIDEDAAARNYVGIFRAFPDRPRKEISRSTDEECALITAAWHHYLTYQQVKDESQPEPELRRSLGQLATAARSWCEAHPGDHRTPTEITQGVTDKNPTRIHTIKPDGSVPTLGLPGEMLLARENFIDMRAQRDKALDEVGRLTLQLLTARRPRPPVTARELHGTTKHRAFAESICDLMYEQLSVCDVNVYGTSERLDRCIVANMLADRLGGDNELGKFTAAGDAPVPMIMHCPACHQRHVDVAFADHPHHTHACQHCGFSWRPAVANTVGVQFLPGFKDEVE